METKSPLVSFLILSYNYESYIGHALKSVLNQTFQNFEIIVVDDCSTDKSVEIIKSFNDERIKLFQNTHNLGGSGSFNVGLEKCSGQWISNLDADDSIDPEKTELSLQFAQNNPDVDVIATWVNILGKDGKRNDASFALEQNINRHHDLNLISTWNVNNYVCRSSTLVKKDLYLLAGGSDVDMVRAPDFELWTRALKSGFRFAFLPIKLTNQRVHSDGVTHGDPVAAFLEISYIIARNIVPVATSRNLYPELWRALDWIRQNVNQYNLPPALIERIVGLAFSDSNINTFSDFRNLIAGSQELAERIGKLVLLRPETPNSELNSIQILQSIHEFSFRSKLSFSKIWTLLIKRQFADALVSIYALVLLSGMKFFSRARPLLNSLHSKKTIFRLK